LFALAISDVLLINLWTTVRLKQKTLSWQDIGRYRASNLGLLRVIFEVNMLLFRSEQKKTLLFVLRDFSAQADNAEIITANIMFHKIWSEMYKQEPDSKATEYFNFEIRFLPHKNFEESAFLKECQDLATGFSSLFPRQLGDRVPLDGLPLFIEKLWDKIRSQRELNLPD